MCESECAGRRRLWLLKYSHSLNTHWHWTCAACLTVIWTISIFGVHLLLHMWSALPTTSGILKAFTLTLPSQRRMLGWWQKNLRWKLKDERPQKSTQTNDRLLPFVFSTIALIFGVVDYICWLDFTQMKNLPKITIYSRLITAPANHGLLAIGRQQLTGNKSVLPLSWW